MDRQDLLRKLAQIEDHAKDGLSEFPQLAKERLRMILALARYLRSECTKEDSPEPSSEAALRAEQDGDANVRSG